MIALGDGHRGHPRVGVQGDSRPTCGSEDPRPQYEDPSYFPSPIVNFTLPTQTSEATRDFAKALGLGYRSNDSYRRCCEQRSPGRTRRRQRVPRRVMAPQKTRSSFSSSSATSSSSSSSSSLGPGAAASPAPSSSYARDYFVLVFGGSGERGQAGAMTASSTV